jgi:basic membrane lipoprotein Med (substrate-binding protein (PBP1-ABC) superfamily)
VRRENDEGRISRKSRSLLAARCSLVLVLLLAVNIGGGRPNDAFSAQSKKGSLRVAAIFATPVEEPWDNVIYQALKSAERKFRIRLDMAENTGYPDFERILREYSGRGYDVIFGDAFGSEDVVRRVAGEFPNVRYVFGSGLAPQPPNLAVFDNWIHEPAYLCGLIAGRLTRTNVIGVVGGHPVPEVNRIINAYIAGAREANPRIKVRLTFINSWFDPNKAKEAALAQIESGADLIYAERFGVIEAAREKGILAFGNLTDQNSLAPETVLTGPVWDMKPLVFHVLKTVGEGKFKATDLREWTMMSRGGASLAPFHGLNNKIPPDLRKLILKKTADIKAGRFRVKVNDRVPAGVR